jgi:hypothetical protein
MSSLMIILLMMVQISGPNFLGFLLCTLQLLLFATFGMPNASKEKVF